MKISMNIILIIVIALVLAGIGSYFLIKNYQVSNFNQNISPELMKLPNNLYIYLPIKSSLIIPEGYKLDDRLLDRQLLIYPKDKKNITFGGTESLHDLEGILVTYGDHLKNEDEFKQKSEEFLENYKKK